MIDNKKIYNLCGRELFLVRAINMILRSVIRWLDFYERIVMTPAEASLLDGERRKMCGNKTDGKTVFVDMRKSFDSVSSFIFLCVVFAKFIIFQAGRSDRSTNEDIT